MSDIKVSFGGVPIVVQLGENTQAALDASSRAVAAAAAATVLFTSTDRAGTIAQRGAIPVGQRTYEMEFHVNDIVPPRTFVWRKDAAGVGADDWLGLPTPSEQSNLGNATGVLKQENAPWVVGGLAGLDSALGSVNTNSIERDGNLQNQVDAIKGDTVAITSLTATPPAVAVGAAVASVVLKRTVTGSVTKQYVEWDGGKYRAYYDPAATDLTVPPAIATPASVLVIGSSLSIPGKWVEAAAAAAGLAIKNAALYASTSRKQALRVGAFSTYLTLASGTLPAAGTEGTVTLINGAAPTYANPDAILHANEGDADPAGHQISGVLGGRHVTIIHRPATAPNVYKIFQDAGGTALAIPDGSEFVPDWKADLATSEIWGDWGQNGYDVPEREFSNLDAILRLTRSPRIYLSGVLNDATQGTGTAGLAAVKAYNAQFKARYPQYYVEMRTALLAAGSSTGDDAADRANEIIPRSQRTTGGVVDSLHPGTAGNTNWANTQIVARTALGVPPALTSATVLSLTVSNVTSGNADTARVSLAGVNAADQAKILADAAASTVSEFGRGPLQSNLFVVARATPDQAVFPSGATGASSGFTLSDLIPIKPSSPYLVSAVGTVAYRWLTSAGLYIAGSYGTTPPGGGGITSPAGAVLLQISTPTNSLRRLMVVAGTSAPSVYIEPAFYDPMTARRLMLSSSIGAIARALGQWNLFIQANALDDYGMGSTGVPYAFAGNNASVTGFIDVTAGDQITSNASTGANAAAFYDVDNLYLSSVTVTAGTPITVPAGASKFRQQFPTTSKSSLIIVSGASLPATYITSPIIEGGLQKRNSLKSVRKSLDLAARAPRNLFNPADTVDDFAISNTGSLYASAGRYTTGFIEITDGIPHLSNYSSQSTFVCYYDENLAIINSGTSYAITPNVPFVPPAGAYYMRRSVNRASGSVGYDSRTDLYVYSGAYATGTVGFASGNAAPGDTVTIGANTLTFVASGATGAQVNIGAANVNTAANLITYINANSATLGVTATLNTAPNTARITSTGIGPTANIALTKSGANIIVSGATLTGAQPVSLALNRFGSGSGSQPQNWAGKSAYIHGDSQTNNGTYQPRMMAITGLAVTSQGTPGRGMNDAATAILTVDLSAFDLIINAHMTNDLNRDSALGTINDDRTVASFYGNMERWLYNVLSRYPTKRVVFLGAPGRTDMTVNGGGNTLKSYNDAMRAFCAKWSIPFLDLLSNAGFNSLNYAAGSAWTSDGLHYNVLGGEMIGRLKGNFVNAMA